MEFPYTLGKWLNLSRKNASPWNQKCQMWIYVICISWRLPALWALGALKCLVIINGNRFHEKKSPCSFSICILWKSTDYATHLRIKKYWIIFTTFVVISRKNCFQLFCEIKLLLDSLAMWKMRKLRLQKSREINSVRICISFVKK